MATVTDVHRLLKNSVRQKLQEPNFLMPENYSNNGGYIYKLWMLRNIYWRLSVNAHG